VSFTSKILTTIICDMESYSPGMKIHAFYINLRDMILSAWETNNRVTIYLIEHLPAELLDEVVPGAPRRTIRMIAGHIHNSRCAWIKTLGNEHRYRGAGQS